MKLLLSLLLLAGCVPKHNVLDLNRQMPLIAWGHRYCEEAKPGIFAPCDTGNLYPFIRGGSIYFEPPLYGPNLQPDRVLTYGDRLSQFYWLKPCSDCIYSCYSANDAHILISSPDCGEGITIASPESVFQSVVPADSNCYVVQDGMAINCEELKIRKQEREAERKFQEQVH